MTVYVCPDKYLGMWMYWCAILILSSGELMFVPDLAEVLMKAS